MPRTQFEQIDNFFNGVNTSAAPDQLPPGSSPRARNTLIKLIGDTGTARFGKRRGALTLNSTPLSGTPGVIGGFQYKQRSGTKINLLVSDTGRLDKLNSDTTTSVINATAFTSGVHYPIFAVANDLCFIVNDVDQKKYDGTSVTAFGITRPAAAPTAAVGAAGGMTGTYEFALSYYNSATGNESSRSDFQSVVLAAQKANVSWSAPADAQITHVRVYMRKTTLGPNAYRLTTGCTPAPNATYGGFAVATTSTVVDIADAVFQALTITAPSTTENDPPASGLKFPCWHQNRMFLADAGNIYYSNFKSNTPYPEAFDPNNTQPINPNDGDTITALYSMWGKLYIFKRFSLWVLDGTDPNSWIVNLVSPNHGTDAMRTITAAEGAMYWWAGTNGPVVFTGDGLPVNIGKTFIQASIAADSLAHTALTSGCAVTDEANETILWAVPDYNQTRNTRLVPFSYRAKRFHAEWWNPFDVYSMWVVEGGDYLKSVYLGNYSGQAFQWWAADDDGVPVSTTRTGTVTSATSTTLTASGATFATAGNGLKDRYVYALNSDHTTIQRRRISSNTATVLTVSAAWDSNPNATFTYVVGGIDWQLDTAWMIDSAFRKHKFEFLHVALATDDVNVSVDMDIFTSQDTSAPKRTATLALAGMGGLYDASSSIYDTTTFGSNTLSFGKIRMGLTGRGWQVRFRNCQVDQDVVLYKVAVQSQLLSTRM